METKMKVCFDLCYVLSLSSYHAVVADKEGSEDRTETNLVNLRRTIYLTIMNALNYEEAVHKLLKVQITEGDEVCVSSVNALQMLNCSFRSNSSTWLSNVAPKSVLTPPSMVLSASASANSTVSGQMLSSRRSLITTQQFIGMRPIACATSPVSSGTCSRRMLSRGLCSSVSRSTRRIPRAPAVFLSRL